MVEAELTGIPEPAVMSLGRAWSVSNGMPLELLGWLKPCYAVWSSDTQDMIREFQALAVDSFTRLEDDGTEHVVEVKRHGMSQTTNDPFLDTQL